MCYKIETKMFKSVTSFNKYILKLFHTITINIREAGVELFVRIYKTLMLA